MDKLELSDIKVMLIDDDTDYLTITKMYLRGKGLNIEAKSDPQEAIEILKQQPVDIILLDYFMPEMTGKEFVENLRQFNTKTLVILQTGFSEEKPPFEMLTELNIQGYHDKSKGVEDLLLLTLSAVRTAKLMKKNKEQEEEISRLHYKNEFIGSLLVGIVNETKSQLMAISAATQSIKEVSSEFDAETNIIARAHDSISNTFQALNFDSDVEGVTVSQMKEKINQLMKFKVARELIQLDIKADYDTQIIDCKANILMYLLIEVIKYLTEKDIKEISIYFKKTESLQILLPSYAYEKEFIEKLKNLAREEEKIEIDFQEENLNMKINGKTF